VSLTLRSYSIVGGYPLFHVTRDNAAVCTACAVRRLEDDCEHDKPVQTAPNWEDRYLTCEDCSSRIPSAY